MTLIRGDVVFSKIGRPREILSTDKDTGDVTFDSDIYTVQEHSEFGIKNGLSPESKESFNTILSDAKRTDKHEEIDVLIESIARLKTEGGDKRLIRYLESDLSHRIVKERYVPLNYKTKADEL